MASCSKTESVNCADDAIILLLGNPNVGKSAIFHRLTGIYVDVSNYPGTTVEVYKAPLKISSKTPKPVLIDSPGVLALPSQTEDEQATVKALLSNNCSLIVQVGDAKNLRRTLALTAVLAEFSLPMILVLNMFDEALERGMVINKNLLSQDLGIPVITTIATTGEGVTELERKIEESVGLNKNSTCKNLLYYDGNLEMAINAIMAVLKKTDLNNQAEKKMVGRENLVDKARALAILYLGDDKECEKYLKEKLFKEELEQISQIAGDINKQSSVKLPAIMANQRAEVAELVAKKCFSRKTLTQPLLSHKIGQLTVHPLFSWPILLLTLFISYEFVGVFGAQYLVELLEKNLMGEIVNPVIISFVENIIPYRWISDIFVGEFGLWTMGMTYALALILPIITTFFITFSILEDSGYMSRLSVLLNRLFSLIGLNGNAVLPMVMGLGCVTMATVTTRILRNPRERIITTFLLALAVPCSAQLGVVLGLLSGIGFIPVLIWLVSITAVMLISGYLASKIIKGRRIPLVTELPPLRLPMFSNVAKKTLSRLKWYLVEVIPLFLIGSFAMYFLDLIGVLPKIIQLAEPLVSGWLGLPKEAAAAFVMGFLRRDFGATGLFALGDALSAVQAVVGVITITLFVPCIASFLVIIREHGIKATMIIVGLIVPLAFFIGGIFNIILSFTGVGV